MYIKKLLVLIVLLASFQNTYAQTLGAEKDSLNTEKHEDEALPAKVFHAEPLYIDLIRDLGARKGERENDICINKILTFPHFLLSVKLYRSVVKLDLKGYALSIKYQKIC